MPYGCGGSASGRAMAFCPSGPGSNPGLTMAFFGSDCPSILAGRWAFSINEVLDHTMRDTSILLSCFLSSLSIFVLSINCNQCTTREINPKRGRERPIFKKKTLLIYLYGLCGKLRTPGFGFYCMEITRITRGQD